MLQASRNAIQESSPSLHFKKKNLSLSLDLSFATKMSDEEGEKEEAPAALNPLAPLVLCGPSGSGKSTLMKLLLDEFGGKFKFSVSHTTRVSFRLPCLELSGPIWEKQFLSTVMYQGDIRAHLNHPYAPYWWLVELKMLDFSDCAIPCISKSLIALSV